MTLTEFQQPNILGLVIAATNARLDRIEEALGITEKTPAENALDAAIDALDAEVAR